ncbi:sugar phosphate isomerase/epimerase [Horticoccus luteus]|uniref:Sugar phosphate isomerase/epimerase n=1 Tax=Horticoccus luteus TaxID=2862869 RepID=A0A8F9TX26_9BACT|nr:sugar phosphate isomerase/epimerase family protein [Horticoccus luteus]QYM79843.1 sugar phosphate isomerase/epimerase [Horticoccus luteus]
MKYGAHIYLWIERWSDAEVGLLARAKSLGLDVLEIAVGLDVSFSSDLTRRAAAEAGMRLITSPGGEWPAAADLSADDPAQRRAAVEFHRRAIDQAAELGALAYAGAIYGRPGTVLKRRPPADELPRTAEGLRVLADFAKERGVGLVIEPMSRFRTHLINTPAQALQLIELAGAPGNVGVMFDTYHMVTELRDPAAAVRALGDTLWGLHACENDRGVPGGGLIPWAPLLAAVGETACDYIGLEGYNTARGDFGWRRGMFQDVCPDGDAFVREGLACLQTQVVDRQ